MRSVCYIADMAVITEQGSTLERVVYFGTVDEVYKDLQESERLHNQALIVHATDPLAVAVARAKLQIVRQFLRHDVNTLPQYPTFGTGTVRMKDAEHPVGFQLTVRVSVRGFDLTGELWNQKAPLNILLPPGV